MANYNTFNLVDTKKRKILLTTSSARKCKKELEKGCRIDVWNENTFIESIYVRNADEINKYVRLEKEHIASKQKRAEERNKRRKLRLEERRAELLNEHNACASAAGT